METKNYSMPDLNGESGNAFYIMSYVRKMLEENKCSHLVKGYLERATSHNYANLIGESYLMIDFVNNKLNKKSKKNEKE